MIQKPTKNYLKIFFRFLSETINEAESAILDFLSAVVVWLVPVIPSSLTYTHAKDILGFNPWIALSAACVTEILGITAISTAIKFWDNNRKYKDPKNHAPLNLALISYGSYLVITLTVNVILLFVAGGTSWIIIFAIGLFSLLSVPSGILISIRTQHRSLLEEKENARNERLSARLQGNNSQQNTQVNNADTAPIPEIAKSHDWRKASRNFTHADYLFIATSPIEDVKTKYGLPTRTSYDWQTRAKAHLEKG